jgi:F-type H+-transporting ATPase subunit delta
MINPRLAGRYAKSLLDLAIEQNQLELIYADMKNLSALCKSNPDFVNMLKSPIIKANVKINIMEAVLVDKVTTLTAAFLKLLVNKTREYSLPEIIKAFLEQYNSLNNIHAVKLTTASPISEDLQQTIINKLKKATSIEKIELEATINEALIGGFTLETNGQLIDASILKDLNDVKNQFKNNEYIHSLK